MITKRKIKYFIYGFLTYLLFRFLFFTPRVHALTMFERTTGSHQITVNEQYVLDQISLVDSNFNIANYPNITCNIDGTSQSGGWYSPTGNYVSSGVQTSIKVRCIFMTDTYVNSITSVSRTTGSSSNSYGISTSVNPANNVCNYYVLLGTNNGTTETNSNYTGYFKWGCLTSGGGNPYTVQSRTFTGSDLTNNLNTNFDIANFSYETNNLIFPMKNYITIRYLDNSFHILKSVDCVDNTQDLCSLDINSNLGSYIYVIYHVKDWVDGFLLMHPNNTYKVGTTLIGANQNTSVYTNELFFYGNSGQGQAGVLSYYPVNQEINFTDDTFNYSYRFNTTSNITADLGVYDFAVRYKTSGSLTTVSVPFSFSLYDLTNDIAVITPTDDQPVFDPNSVIISQNETIINNINLANAYLDDIHSAILDDNVTGGTNSATSYFNNFNNNTHGLSGIISTPLVAISRITSSSCTPISIPFPHTEENLVLACLSPYYRQYIPSLLTLWQTVSFGIIAYYICLDIFKMVKDFKDPDKDKIEVLDL